MFKFTKILYCLLAFFLYNTSAQCNVTLNEDIIFIVDASTHFNSSDWTHIKTLMNNTIAKSPSIARYGIISCSSTCQTILSLSSNITGTSAYTYVNSMTQDTTTSNFKAYTGYILAKDNFVANSSQKKRKTLIMIAGGDSFDNQCQTDVRKLSNINGIVITMGKYYYKYVYACIAKDRVNGYISQYETFSTTTVLSLTNAITYHTCPATPLIYFTEIQPNAVATNGRFVELFNDGWDVDSRYLTFLGLFEGTLLNAFNFTQGQFLVLYWGDDTGVVHCHSCNTTTVTPCTLQQKGSTSSYWCSESKYIACSKGSTYVAQSYETKDDGCKVNTQTNINFNVSVSYNGNNIDLVKYDPNDYWYATPVSYSLELKYLGYNNDYGSSWVMSCNSSGSPGSQRVGSCGCSSSSTYCTANGVSAATCSSSTCTCNTNGYYGFEWGCYPFPTPDNCTATVIAGGTSTHEIDYLIAIPEWDGLPSFLIDKVCITTCDQKKGATGVLETVTGITNIVSTATAQLRYEQDNTVLSNATNCTIRTHAPTMVPTSAPTYMLPTIPSCSVTLNKDLNAYIANWTTPVYNYPVTPRTSDFQEYRVYQNNILGTGFVAQVKNNSTLSASVLMSNTPVATWTLGVTNVSVGVLFNSIDDEIDGKVATPCTTVYTQAPTKAPTLVPTRVPTNVPTHVPTVLPTRAPTLGDLIVGSCTLKITQKQTAQATITWDEPNFQYPITANKSNTEYMVVWPGGSFTIPAGTSNVIGIQFPMNGFDISTEYNSVSMYAKWSYSVNGGSVSGQSSFNTSCNLTTFAPTSAPTRVPSNVPTKVPTKIPTTMPTSIPTFVPTALPTYYITPVNNCSATFGNGNKQMTLQWTIITILEPFTPNASNVYYEVSTPEGLRDVDHDTATLIDNTTATKLFSLENPFYYNSSITITVKYKSGIYASNAVTTCATGTASPTEMPTQAPTLIPTQEPTYGEVYVWLIGDQISSCNIYNNSDILSRCGCDYNDYTSNTCNNSDTPIDVVDEKQPGKYTSFSVQRSFNTYDYNISITYSFSFVNNTTANDYGFYNSMDNLEEYYGVNGTSGVNDDNSTSAIPKWIIPNDTYWYSKMYEISGTTGPTINDIKTWNGTFILTTQFDTGSFDVSIEREFLEKSFSETNKDDYAGEIFLLTLTSCTVIPRNDTENVDNDILICKLVYPSQTFIMVQDKDVYDTTIEKTVANTSWQDWFWYALIAIILFLMILGYFVYRWWVNKRLAEAEVQQTEADIDAVVKEQEEGFGNDLGDGQVTINPMAQGLAHLKKPNQTMAGQKGNTNTTLSEQAQVNVEKFHERQEFGPQQINRGGDTV